MNLTELWRRGGPGDDVVFGGPGQPAVSQAGRVAVPDAVAGTVLVLDPDGSAFGEITRKGEGPGEVQWPIAAEWITEERVAVFDFSVGKIVEVALHAGEESQEWRIRPELFAQIGAAGQLPGLDLVGDGSVLLELPWTPLPGQPEVRQAVVVWHRRDGEVDTLEAQEVRVLTAPLFRDWPIAGQLRPVMAGGADGRVALAGAVGAYEIRVLNHDGADSAVLCRGAEPYPLTQHERGLSEPEGAPRGLAELLREAPSPERILPFGIIFLGGDGRLWVLRDRLDPMTYFSPVEGGTYDIFDDQGEYWGTVSAPPRTVFFGEGGGQVYGFERGEYDDLRLVAYAVDQTGG